MKEQKSVIQLKDQFYSFQKIHVLGFDQFHQPILTEKQSLIKIKFQQIKAKELLALQLQDSLKIYLLTRLEENQFQRSLVLTNPLGLQLLKNIKSKLSKNNQIKENFGDEKSLNNCLEETANDHPDLLVEDIYGKDSSSIGLPQKLLASSLGKLAKIFQHKFQSKQILRSLVMALAINTAQISGLLSRKLKISDIIVLQNEINGVSFHRLIYVLFSQIQTLLNYYSPESNLYVKSSISQQMQ